MLNARYSSSTFLLLVGGMKKRLHVALQIPFLQSLGCKWRPSQRRSIPSPSFGLRGPAILQYPSGHP